MWDYRRASSRIYHGVILATAFPVDKTQSSSIPARMLPLILICSEFGFRRLITDLCCIGTHSQSLLLYQGTGVHWYHVPDQVNRDAVNEAPAVPEFICIPSVKR